VVHVVVFHSLDDMNELQFDDRDLKLLSVSRDLVPYDFSTGVNVLDRDNIMINIKGLVDHEQTDAMPIDMVKICHDCYKDLKARQRLPNIALANYRWLGHTPNELANLTWIEEALVARGHLVGKVVRLQNRYSSYAAAKGHLVLVPQDTCRLLDLLPLSPESLADTIRVVWVGDTEPSRASLRQTLTVRKQKVYDGLKWLCLHHEDYRHVSINENELDQWPDVFIVDSLIDTMGRMRSSELEDTSRSEYGVEDVDNNLIHGNLPLTSSVILDVNRVSENQDAELLSEIADFQRFFQERLGSTTCGWEKVVNVVPGSSMLSDYDDEQYFTAAFPTLFPYGTGKHLQSRRQQPLSFKTWLSLLLQHSSRYIL